MKELLIFLVIFFPSIIFFIIVYERKEAQKRLKESDKFHRELMRKTVEKHLGHHGDDS